MKYRHSFVTNSSSSCFVIVNKTDVKKTVVDLVTELRERIDIWNKEGHYMLEELLGEDWCSEFDDAFDGLLHEAHNDDMVFEPNITNLWLNESPNNENYHMKRQVDSC